MTTGDTRPVSCGGVFHLGLMKSDSTSFTFFLGTSADIKWLLNI